MKIIQAIIVVFAILGCLALALGGYFVYNMSTKGGGDTLLSKIKAVRSENPAKEETSAPVTAAPPANSEYAKIIQQYQPSPTPAPAVAPAGQPGAAALTRSAGAPVVSSGAAVAKSAVRTPKPDEGKIRDWPSGRKWVALTYDDGPHPEWTPKMIELLRSKNVDATFFLLGQEIKRFPEIARTIHDNGFEVGNHTMNHPDFNKSSMTPDAIMEQLKGTNDLIAENVTKEPVRIMRPPFGNTPKKLVDACQELGLSIVCWSIDTDDWRSKTDAKAMEDNIMKHLADGAIILMHDKHQKTYDTTAAVIDKIREKGYEFVTVSELLGLKPHAPGGPVEASARQGNVAAAQTAPAAAPVAAAAPTDQVAAAPAAPSDQTVDSGASNLPVPSAATPTPEIDASKITQPPPQR